jgi:hypothetical protein
MRDWLGIDWNGIEKGQVESPFFSGFQEFRYFDFTELGIWLCGPSNRWTRFDWDRLPKYPRRLF